MKPFSKKRPASAGSAPIRVRWTERSEISFAAPKRDESSSSLGAASGRATSARCAAILSLPYQLQSFAVLLVDTSVWIEVFRKPSGIQLDEVCSIDEIGTCLPVVQEVLQGFLDDRAYRVARDAMLSFPIVESPLEADVFVAAAELYRTARRAGVTVRSGADCLIAVCALRHGLTVVHRDRDFDALSRVSPLSARRI
jgi:predicted nucleic acid-binding protein